MKRNAKLGKLKFNSETIRRLQDGELGQAAGGAYLRSNETQCSGSCNSCNNVETVCCHAFTVGCAPAVSADCA